MATAAVVVESLLSTPSVPDEKTLTLHSLLQTLAWCAAAPPHSTLGSHPPPCCGNCLLAAALVWQPGLDQLQDWLLHAWPRLRPPPCPPARRTERGLPRLLEQRGHPEEPCFCFETALKAAYCSLHVYCHFEVGSRLIQCILHGGLLGALLASSWGAHYLQAHCQPNAGHPPTHVRALDSPDPPPTCLLPRCHCQHRLRCGPP